MAGRADRQRQFLIRRAQEQRARRQDADDKLRRLGLEPASRRVVNADLARRHREMMERARTDPDPPPF